MLFAQCCKSVCQELARLKVWIFGPCPRVGTTCHRHISRSLKCCYSFKKLSLLLWFQVIVNTLLAEISCCLTIDIALELPPPMNGSHDQPVANLKCLMIPMCSNALLLFLQALAWEPEKTFSGPTGPPDIIEFTSSE